MFAHVTRSSQQRLHKPLPIRGELLLQDFGVQIAVRIVRYYLGIISLCVIWLSSGL